MIQRHLHAQQYLIVLVLSVLCVITACGGPPPPHWTSAQAMAAIRAAGLPVEQVHPPEASEIPAPPGTDALFFVIPVPDGGAKGYIISFPSAAEAEHVRERAQLSPDAAADPTFAIIVFTHDNLCVMLFGITTPATLRQYKAAVQTLR
jgi:hypothetical protein